MTRVVLSWKEAFAAGTAACGGKGFNLARLERYGFAIPRGGVVTAGAYRSVMSAPDILDLASALAGADADDASSISTASRLTAMQDRIVASRLPDDVRAELASFLAAEGLSDAPVAVRSSATAEDGAAASFAGIHRSVLDARGIDAVERATIACYASLWTPQALAYRRRMGFADGDVQCAVAICEMVARAGSDEPAFAGVAFSADPMTGRRDMIVIESSRGIGEHVVDGSVDPDRVVLRRERERYAVESRRVQSAPVLTPGEEIELAKLVWRIHWALGDGQEPQDVEWAHDGRRFVILQSRPVTRLPHYTFEGAKHLPVHWSTANIKEAIPGVYSMLGWSLVQETVGGVLYGNVTSAGIDLDRGVQHVRRFDGRAFFDVTAIQWRLYDTLGVTPAQVNLACGGHQPEIPVPHPDPLQGPDAPRRKKAQLRLLRALYKLPRKLDETASRLVAETRRIVEAEARDDRELLELMHSMLAVSEGIEAVAGLANSAASVWKEPLERQLRAIAGDRAESLLVRLMAGRGGVTSAEQGYRLYDLAVAAKGDPAALAWIESRQPAVEWTSLPAGSPFRASLQRFLGEFGHRAVYEGDVANPRWSEDPAYIVDHVRELIESGAPDPREASRRVRDEALNELRRLAFFRRPLILWLAVKLQRATARRELAKSVLVACVPPARRIVLDLGRRMTADGRLDTAARLFDLSIWEIFALLSGEWDGRGARELAADRAARRAAWQAMPDPADVITIEPDGAMVRRFESDASNGDGWSGVGVSGGRAEGIARAVRHPDEGAKLGRGEILVAPSTDPGWTPLFLRAAGLVMETGGFLSHGATVAREFGIPAVVNIHGILGRIEDGERIAVDGDAGRVARLR